MSPIPMLGVPRLLSCGSLNNFLCRSFLCCRSLFSNCLSLSGSLSCFLCLLAALLLLTFAALVVCFLAASDHAHSQYCYE